MILELMIGYFALKSLAEEIDRCSYEHDILYDEIDDLKEEIEQLKNLNSYNCKR